jgi:hypothetical protein
MSVISAIPALVSVIIGQLFVKEVKRARATTVTDAREIGLFVGLNLLIPIFAFANFSVSFFILVQTLTEWSIHKWFCFTPSSTLLTRLLHTHLVHLQTG